MIQIFEIEPCADYIGHLQVEGNINNECFSIETFERLLERINFRIFSVGDPKVLICKRSDGVLMIKSDGSFHISQVPSKERLKQIIDDISGVQS